MEDLAYPEQVFLLSIIALVPLQEKYEHALAPAVTYMINTHENADLTFQTGFDLGVKAGILFDNLHCVLFSSLSTRCLVHRRKISGSEFHAEHILTFECLCTKRTVGHQSLPR